MADGKRVIMGAAGLDFHNSTWSTGRMSSRRWWRFTAAQIPDIEGLRYPSELSGGLTGTTIEPDAPSPAARLRA